MPVNHNMNSVEMQLVDGLRLEFGGTISAPDPAPGAPERTVVMTFPPEGRPAAQVDFDVPYDGGTTTVSVTPAGELLANPRHKAIQLDGCSFPVAPRGSG